MRATRKAAAIGAATIAVVVVALLFATRGEETVAAESERSAPGAAPGTSRAAPPVAAIGRATSTVTDAGSESSPERPFAKLEWGSGPGQLGRHRPTEGNPEGPMSLTVDGHGNLLILDQVNGRLVKLDRSGAPAGEVKLSVQAPQDVVVTRDGKTLVLDRLVDKTISVAGPDGTPLGELPITGKGLAEGGAATGVFSDGPDVYVEREHADLVRVGGADGKADPARPEVPGRPSRDGKLWLTANIVDPAAGTVMLTVIDRPTSAHRFTRQYTLAGPVPGLDLLDSDASGVIYLGALVQAPLAAPDAEVSIAVLCLDPQDGKALGHAFFPANTDADETFRELTLSDDGTLYFLRRTEAGAEVLTRRCGP